MEMHSDIEITDYWCWNRECPDYGKKDYGNIRVKEIRGKEQRALLQCRTCLHCFSETRGTPFFGLRTSLDEVARTLSILSERGSIRATSRITGHKQDTIIHWIRLAGKHAKEVNDYFLQDLHMNQVQVDEIWSYIKKRRKTSNHVKNK